MAGTNTTKSTGAGSRASSCHLCHHKIWASKSPAGQTCCVVEVWFKNSDCWSAGKSKADQIYIVRCMTGAGRAAACTRPAGWSAWNVPFCTHFHFRASYWLALWRSAEQQGGLGCTVKIRNPYITCWWAALREHLRQTLLLFLKKLLRKRLKSFRSVGLTLDF